jgi:hypothetical protein
VVEADENSPEWNLIFEACGMKIEEFVDEN